MSYPTAGAVQLVMTMIESVAVRQRGGFDFETHYDNLCALQSSCPLPAVKAHLAEGILDLNGDRIRSVQQSYQWPLLDQLIFCFLKIQFLQKVAALRMI